MKPNDVSDSTLSNVYSKIVIVVLFVVLMVVAVIYFNDSKPNVHAEMMDNLAQQFTSNTINAHWQWQAEGRPQMIIMVQYDFQGKETGRQPLRMSRKGWPYVGNDNQGCERVWQGLLNMQSRVDDFRVISEYYDDGVNENGETQQRCRFRLSTGPYFDYYVNSGRVERND